MRPKEQLAGHVGVDAGLIWIGDPCYVLPDDAKHAYGNWGEFCAVLHKKENMGAPAVSVGIDGVCIKNFGGDGTFPVYVEVDKDGLVKSARIVFDE